MKSMCDKTRYGPVALLSILGILILCQPLLAHPGHTDIPSIPLPAWRLASDGRVFSAFFLKTQDDRVWLVDKDNRTTIVSLADLDAASRESAQRSLSRLRTINMEPTEIRRPAEGVLAMALTAMLAEGVVAPASTPQAAKAFMAFNRVKTRWDDSYLYVESDGLPDHPMMTGIRAWQQQVPLPQMYIGDNAWRIPLKPAVAQSPAMIKDHFMRGAIALAANGIPIFNPQNNRGEISQEIGELDEWGGHCGRADDYHYHVVPLHLQNIVGKGMPMAYALDGYPIYGLTEPDGSPVANLDECHGHTTGIGYHYHASTKYPYVISGFHGEVIERENQVDPQPRANPVRGALPPLRGATITDFKSTGKDQYQLTYEIGARKGYVRYALNADASYTFTFEDPQGQKREETFKRGGGRPHAENRAPEENGRPSAKERKGPGPDAIPAGAAVATAGAGEKKGFTLRSSAVEDGGMLPKDYSGDGSSATLPLEWSGAPAGTKSYALIMHHLDPEGKTKWYWILYNIPADVTNIPRNAKGVGTLGNNSVNRKLAYAPPHSKGPGAKTYILTLYALSSAPQIAAAPADVDRATLLDAIKDRTLASTDLKVVYDRTAIIGGAADGGEKPAPGVRAGRPDREPAGDPPGNRGPGGEFHLLPREVEEELKLTADEEKQLQDLASEIQGKLNRILTPEQREILKQSRPPRPSDGADERPRPR
jgi:phosphatidylethanolamine-binding protein (PEBP) family uncharacterized protein